MCELRPASYDFQKWLAISRNGLPFPEMARYFQKWPAISRNGLPFRPAISGKREIKIRVYGKRERQKLPRDHNFPAIFHVCRLPFAVLNAKRTVFAFVNNVSIYHKFFNLYTTFTDLTFGLMLFYFIFYAK